jgi:hypothetical protein
VFLRAALYTLKRYGRPVASGKRKTWTRDYFVTATSVIFFWGSRMSFRRLLDGRKWKALWKPGSIRHR